MTRYRDPNRVQTFTERTYTWYGWTLTHTDLRRLIGLITLPFVVLNGMIALRSYSSYWPPIRPAHSHN